MILGTMGASGAVLTAGVAQAPSADAATGAPATGTVVDLGDVPGPTASLDLSQGDTFLCTLTGDTTFTVGWLTGTEPSPAVAMEPTVILTQDSVGGHKVYWNNVTWLPSGTGPAYPTGAGQAGVFCFLTPDFGASLYGQGALPVGGGFGVYGDGSDGDIVLDGGSEAPPSCIGRGTQLNYYWALRDIYASSQTITSGTTLQLGGGGTAPFRLLCSGTVTINGGFVVTHANTLTSGTLHPGGAGGAGTTTKGTGAAGAGVYGVLGAGASAAGGAGGANSAGNAGGAGGGVSAPGTLPAGTLPRALPDLASLALVDGAGVVRQFGGGAGGGAGAGDGSNAGGSGGTGGNPLFLAACSLVNTGTVAGYGGNGGAGAGNSGGGGGGQGGPVVVICGTYSGNGTISSPGGTGGAGAGSGKAGANGGSGWIIQLAN
jgi:hypothetical protein